MDWAFRRSSLGLGTGKSHPTIETLERPADHLGVPMRDFLDFDDGNGAANPQRITLLTAICEFARTLDDRDLEIAAAQITVLANRSHPKR